MRPIDATPEPIVVTAGIASVEYRALGASATVSRLAIPGGAAIAVDPRRQFFRKLSRRLFIDHGKIDSFANSIVDQLDSMKADGTCLLERFLVVLVWLLRESPLKWAFFAEYFRNVLEELIDALTR